MTPALLNRTSELAVSVACHRDERRDVASTSHVRRHASHRAPRVLDASRESREAI